MSDVGLSDTATYQCKVKKAPGVDMRKVTLVVMGEEEFLITGFTCSFSERSHSSFKCCSHLPGILKLFLVSLPLSVCDHAYSHTFNSPPTSQSIDALL